MDKLIQGLLIAVIILGSGYFVYSFTAPAPDTPDVTDMKTDVTEQKQSNIQQYTLLGVQHELPDGWSIDETIETHEEYDLTHVSYVVSNPTSDLSIELWARGIRHGYEGCGIEYSQRTGLQINLAELMEAREILVSEPLAYEPYHLIGFTGLTWRSDKLTPITKLTVVNDDDSNWHSDSLYYIESHKIEEGKEYFTCTILPSNGSRLETLKEYYPGEGWGTQAGIWVSSKNDELLEHMTSRSREFQEVLEILNTIKPI